MTTPARVTGFVVATLGFLVATAAPTWAQAPTTWADTEGRGVLGNVIFFGGATFVLYVVIVVFSLVISRRNYVVPAPAPSADIDHH